MVEKKDRTTFAHQIVTLIGIPVLIALLGWGAVTFDAMRFDIVDLKNDVKLVKRAIGLDEPRRASTQ